MYNSPHEEESLPRVLPGKLLSLDAQCRKDRGTSACVEAEQLSAHSVVFEASAGAAILSALRVKRKQFSGKNTRQTLLFVRGVVHASCSLATKKLNKIIHQLNCRKSKFTNNQINF